MTTDLNWFTLNHETPISTHELLVDILRRFHYSTFNELLRRSGKVEALAAMKPRIKFGMNFAWKNFKEHFDTDGNGPDLIMLFYAWCQTSVVPPELQVGEIREKGSVLTCTDCLMKDAVPEWCIVISHFGTEEAANIVNPNCECIITHHLTDGDPYCRFVFKKRSEKNINDLGKLVNTLPKLQMPKEEAFGLTVWALTSWWDMITGSFIDLNGSETANDFFYKNSRQIGHQIGEELVKLNKDMRKDLESVGQFIRSLGFALNQQSIGCSMTPREFKNEIFACALQGHPKEICQQWNHMIAAMVESINPELEFSCDKMITQGDETCHWTLTEKSSARLADDLFKVQ